MCLPSRCQETALVYSPISLSSHGNGCTRYINTTGSPSMLLARATCSSTLELALVRPSETSADLQQATHATLLRISTLICQMWLQPGRGSIPVFASRKRREAPQSGCDVVRSRLEPVTSLIQVKSVNCLRQIAHSEMQRNGKAIPVTGHEGP